MARVRIEEIGVSRSQVTIRVYPFNGDKAVDGWIAQGCLTTSMGPPAKRVKIEIVRPSSNQDRMDAYLVALRCLMRQKYLCVDIMDAQGNFLERNAV